MARIKSQAYGIGILFNTAALWIGVHYSEHNRRYCINVIPFVTLWITKPGGKTP